MWIARLLPLVIVVTCVGPPAESGPRYTVSDSAGIRVVVSHAPQWETGDEWRLSAEPSVRIGPTKDGPEYQFWRVTAVRTLSDGTIAVLNSGSNELRLFDSTGIHLRTFGKMGPGPGEFERAWGLQVSGDTLMVLDGLGSIAYFHRETGFLRETARYSVFDGPYSADRLLPDRSVFAMRPIHRASMPTGLDRPPFEIARGTESGDLMTFGVYPGILQAMMGEGRTRRAVVPPYATRTQYQVDSRRSLVAVGDNADYALKVFDVDGTLRRIIRRAVPRSPVTEADVEAWKAVQRRLAWTRGQLPALERMWLDIAIPKTKPAYGPFAFSGRGDLWVGQSVIDGQPSRAYSVFDDRGAWLGDVQIPPGLRHWYREVDIGADRFVGVWVDDSGVEEVRAYAIHRP